jgi:serine/threonine protein kinase
MITPNRGLSLTPGSRIGPYEITAQIGVGGMGEVYRATDTNLARQVAIKVLPQSMAPDPERLARFDREAKTLAALSHPNIAAIYGLERSGGQLALVMELVEGPTLADRIAEGPIPVDDALTITTQIAEALEAAHEHGVVHRDLKPANIKVRPDGIVKVLDFGLAKATEPGAGLAPDVTRSPTITTPAMTQLGILLGTAAYMSPEQARGQPVDTRSDVWALGCVLYEMLTGSPAFHGGDVAGILARVLEREPDWTRLPEVTPAVQRLLRLCLEKDRKNRRQAAGDVRIDIDHARRSKPAESSAAPSARHASFVWLTVAAVAAVAVAAFAFPSLRFTQPSQSEMRVEVRSPSTLAPFQFALSPDGRYIVFVASGDGPPRLWLRALDNTDARPLTGTDGAEDPFWSPDSRSIGFFAARTLYRIGIADSTRQEIARAPGGGGGGTWSPDGTILFGEGLSFPMRRVAASGGDPVTVTTLQSGQSGHRFPQFLPDGRRFLFHVAGRGDTSGIYFASLDGRAPKRLMTADTSAVFLPPDRVLFVRDGLLIAQRLNLSAGELTGEPVTLAVGVGSDARGRGGFSVSSDGRVAYRTGGDTLSQLTWRTRAGKSELAAVELADNSYLELSPEGTRAAVQRVVNNNLDIWLTDLERGGSSRFTYDTANDQLPTWSPDGAFIAFSSNRAGPNNLYLKSVSGAVGSEELLLDTPNPKQPQHWSKDGRFLLYYEIDPQTGRDLWALERNGGSWKPRVVANTQSEERGGQISPDGLWVAYETNESGRFEVVVQPFPEPGARRAVSTGGGMYARWSADGSEIYFMTPESMLMAVPVTRGSGRLGTRSPFDAGRPVPLFSARMGGGRSTSLVRPPYAVSRDGRFLIDEPVESPTTPITLLLNWRP